MQGWSHFKSCLVVILMREAKVIFKVWVINHQCLGHVEVHVGRGTKGGG